MQDEIANVPELANYEGLMYNKAVNLRDMCEVTEGLLSSLPTLSADDDLIIYTELTDLTEDLTELRNDLKALAADITRNARITDVAYQIPMVKMTKVAYDARAHDYATVKGNFENFLARLGIGVRPMDVD